MDICRYAFTAHETVCSKQAGHEGTMHSGLIVTGQRVFESSEVAA